MVSLKDIHKSFSQDRKILEGISLDIEPGQAFALLGPNGAGKTTLVRIIATLLLPDSGQISVNGCDALRSPLEARRRLGCSLDSERSFFMRLSARENLRFFAALQGVSPARIGELLDFFGLTRDADLRVQEFSSGMKQKLSLARAMLADPPVLILDEPTRGLDPLAAAEFRATLAHLLKGRSKTILLVTHSLDEAVELGEAAGILFRGRLNTLSEDWRQDLPKRYKSTCGESA